MLNWNRAVTWYVQCAPAILVFCCVLFAGCGEANSVQQSICELITPGQRVGNPRSSTASR